MHFGIGGSRAPGNFVLRDEISDIDRRFARAILQKDSLFPYTFVTFIAMSSAAPRTSTPFTRYKYFRLQLDLLAAWVQSENWVDGGRRRGTKTVLGALFWRVAKASQQLQLKKHKIKIYRNMSTSRTKYHAIEANQPRKGGGTFLLNRASRVAPTIHEIWSIVSEKDAVAMLLLRVTALTVDPKYWIRLSEFQKNYVLPTKVVVIELAASPLGYSRYFKPFESGYRHNTFNLDLIGHYLATKRGIPDVYQLLFKTWGNALNNRIAMRPIYKQLQKGEGIGRVALVRCQCHSRRAGVERMTNGERLALAHFYFPDQPRFYGKDGGIT